MHAARLELFQSGRMHMGLNLARESQAVMFCDVHDAFPVMGITRSHSEIMLGFACADDYGWQVMDMQRR